MKTRLVACCCAGLLTFGALAAPRTVSLLQNTDNQSEELSLGAGEIVEVLTAYDFYGAAGSILIKRGKLQFSLAPGHAAGGPAQCTPHPFVLAGPAEILVESGNTQGARPEHLPFVVTLRIRREANAPPATKVAK